MRKEFDSMGEMEVPNNAYYGAQTQRAIETFPVSGIKIPQSLINRVEIVKGPSSTLYGSEAVGGIINIITKSPQSAPKFSADVFGSTWGEINTDLGVKFKAKKAYSLIGINHFNYQNKIDNNDDGITDLALQDRISIFNKWSFDRKDNRLFTVAGRYLYEDRWGGNSIGLLNIEEGILFTVNLFIQIDGNCLVFINCHSRKR